MHVNAKHRAQKSAKCASGKKLPTTRFEIERRRDDNTNNICAFEKGIGRIQRGKSSKNTVFLKCKSDCREILLSLRRLLEITRFGIPPKLANLKGFDPFPCIAWGTLNIMSGREARSH